MPYIIATLSVFCPPVSALTPEQAAYHFSLGYTAKRWQGRKKVLTNHNPRSQPGERRDEDDTTCVFALPGERLELGGVVDQVG